MRSRQPALTVSRCSARIDQVDEFDPAHMELSPGPLLPGISSKQFIRNSRNRFAPRLQRDAGIFAIWNPLEAEKVMPDCKSSGDRQQWKAQVERDTGESASAPAFDL